MLKKCLPACALLFSACAVTPGKSFDQACTEPRPQMCTMDYRPVCGVSNDGSRKVYGNACGACGNAEVVGFSDGEC